MLLSLMLGVSYYMQGTGFNTQYFYHLDMETVAIAAQAYGGIFYPALLWLVLAFFAPLVFYRGKAARRSSALAAAVVWIGAVANAHPVRSLVNYGLGGSHDMSAVMPQLPVAVLRGEKAEQAVAEMGYRINPASQPAQSSEQIEKNIIVIYAEGLE